MPKQPRYTEIVERLRHAAELATSGDDREWFTATANRLEAGQPVMCLDEITLYANRAISAAS